MTTEVTILNHGPDHVSVTPATDDGQPITAEQRVVAPQNITKLYVYGNRNVLVKEIRPPAAHPDEPKAA